MKNKIVSKKLETELMLYDSKQDEVHILNQTALLTYELYKKGKTPEQIAQEIKEKFNLNKDHDVLSDVQKCIDEIRVKNLS